MNASDPGPSKAHASQKKGIAMTLEKPTPVSAPSSFGPGSRTPITHWTELLPRLKNLKLLFAKLDKLEVEDIERRASLKNQAHAQPSDGKSRAQVRANRNAAEGVEFRVGAKPSTNADATSPFSAKALEKQKQYLDILGTQRKQRTIICQARREADDLGAEVVQFEKALEGEIEDLRDVLRRIRESKPMVNMIREKYEQRCKEIDEKIQTTKKYCTVRLERSKTE